MANKIAELKNALGVGARVNKYRVNMAIPAAVPTSGDLSTADTLCKASSFPGVSLGQIEVFNQGRKLVVPGDTTYENAWTLTFYQTEDHALRRDLIAWMKAADHFQDNSHSGNADSILGELSVEQLDSAGNATVRYTFHNVFVQEVGAVDLTGESDSGVQEFTVTFAFSDWTVGSNRLNEPESATPATRNDVAE